MTVALFWICIAGLAYIYVGYPALVWCCARLVPRQSLKCDSGAAFSVVIVAYNEAANLSRKIASILNSAASAQICEIIVALDGSTDASEAVLKTCPDSRLRILSWPERRGKPAVLNDVIPLCRSEIIVLNDSRQDLHPRALGELVANFADPGVGVVSGELVFRESNDATAAAQGIGFYWKYEKFIRKQESRFRSVPGATGACYAIRKEAFRPLDPQTLLDDVVIPMQAVIQGFRCTFEPEAIAYDYPSKSPRQEAIRKRRTIAGNVQLLVHHPRWLLPWRNPIWLEFVSHKLSRLISPLFLVGAAVTNVLLVNQLEYRLLLAIQLCLYFSAALGWILQTAGRKSKYFGPPLIFLTLNLTTVAAIWDAARGRYKVTWNRTA